MTIKVQITEDMGKLSGLIKTRIGN